MKKENLLMDGWLKEVAPCDTRRHWFGYDPAKWEEFCRRYDAELEANSSAWHPRFGVGLRLNRYIFAGCH